MKKIIYYFVLVTLMIFSTASSCKKPTETEEELPTGENTMYYYVNGELYIPKDNNIGGMYAPAIGYGICLDGGSFDISTINLLIHFNNGIQQIEEIMLNQSHYDICQVFDNHAFYGQATVFTIT